MKESFVEETLSSLFKNHNYLHIKQIDKNLATEIAYGTVRNCIFIQNHLEHDLKVQKPKEIKKMACLMAALYQRLFHQSMAKSPHALVYEYVEIAKCLFGKIDPFFKFLNAILRKSLLVDTESLFIPPSIDDIKNSSNRIKNFFSIPDTLFLLLKDSFKNQPEELYQVLLSTSAPIPLYARKPYCHQTSSFPLLSLDQIQKESDDVPLNDPEGTPLYIQNITQPRLIEGLLAAMRKERPGMRVHKAIDLCAAPGGKSVMCWQALKPAEFILNEPSARRLQKLKENVDRFGVNAAITTHDGTVYPLPECESDRFDLVIVDAPCSNTGVLYKCPEAKYRLKQAVLKEHVSLQKKLLERASALLKEDGCIWYLTCSILDEENGKQIKDATESLNLSLIHSQKIIPDGKIHEGGYAALLCKKKI